MREADLIAFNGVMHVVNDFFTPPFLTQSLLDSVAATEGAGHIKQLVVTAGLETVVAEPDRTLLAPDGSAFAMIPAKLFFCN